MSKIWNLIKSIILKKRSPQKGANYICSDCGAQEIIPFNVLEEFDLLYPEQLLYGPHTFKCEKCHTGNMQPEHYQAIVKGAGLYEGLDYTIESSKPKKRKSKKTKKRKKRKK